MLLVFLIYFSRPYPCTVREALTVIITQLNKQAQCREECYLQGRHQGGTEERIYLFVYNLQNVLIMSPLLQHATCRHNQTILLNTDICYSTRTYETIRNLLKDSSKVKVTEYGPIAQWVKVTNHNEALDSEEDSQPGLDEAKNEDGGEEVVVGGLEVAVIVIPETRYSTAIHDGQTTYLDYYQQDDDVGDNQCLSHIHCL